MDFAKIKQKIISAKSIAVASHINPDGDSIGSLLSLGLGMEKLGKQVYMVSVDGVPSRYKRLPGADHIRRRLEKKVDLAIAVDCSNKEILGGAYEIFKSAGNTLEIDHHEFRRPFGKMRLIDYKAAAVAELIYLVLERLNIGIDKRIAQNLLTSIIVETNSFRLPNVRPLTFKVCERLMKKGVDFYKLADMVFWSISKESAVLAGICLARCRFIGNNRVAWSIVRKKDFELAKGKDENVDAVADEMRSIQGVEIAVLFREKNKEYLRVSLRSKGKINVANIAEYYNGGGHFDIAGCNIPNNSRSIAGLLNMAKKLLQVKLKNV